MKRKLLCRELLFVNKRASSLSKMMAPYTKSNLRVGYTQKDLVGEMVSLKNQGHKYLDNWCTWKNGNDLFVLPSCYMCVEKRNPNRCHSR